jgi:hypothetical protein
VYDARPSLVNGATVLRASVPSILRQVLPCMALVSNGKKGGKGWNVGQDGSCLSQSKGVISPSPCPEPWPFRI